MATAQDYLIQLQQTYSQLLAQESAAQLANGPKPNYNLDGVSVDWEGWRTGMEQKIKDLTRVIQDVGGPFEVRSRAV